MSNLLGALKKTLENTIGFNVLPYDCNNFI
jgi:hypothetical protein